MENKRAKMLANIALLVCAMIWGIGFVATDIALKEGIKPYYTMAIRFFIAFILLAIVFFRKLKNANKEDLKAGLVIGTALFLAFAAQTVGLQFTTPGKQAFLTGLYVVIVPFLYWIIVKKAPDKFQFIATGLCLVGTALLTLDKGLSITKGDTLTLVSAVFFALHIVIVGHYTKKSDPIILTILQMVVAGVLSLAMALITGEAMPTKVSLAGWGSVFYLGAISTMVAYMIQNVSLKYTSSTEAAIILCLETVFGSVFSAILLKENFTPKMILGCVIIFIALITAETKLSFLRKPKNKKDKDKKDKDKKTEDNLEVEI